MLTVFLQNGAQAHRFVDFIEKAGKCAYRRCRHSQKDNQHLSFEAPYDIAASASK
jgi:putative ribosome biogenesis GTPase RsgA